MLKHGLEWEARLARRPTCPSQVFLVSKRVADLGNEAMQKQCFSIVGTREQAFAMRVSQSVSLPLFPDVHPYKNQIFLVGRRQGACRLVSPGLQRSSQSVDVVGYCAKDVRH